MALSTSRFNATELNIEAFIARNAASHEHYKLLHHTWSPFDSAFQCKMRHIPTGTELDLYVNPETKDWRWHDPKKHEACKEFDRVAHDKTRRNRFMNDCKGEFVESVKLYRVNGEKPHVFAKGVGPCGRNVVGLKVLDLSSKLVIYQFCDDEVRPDEFTYRTDLLSNWSLSNWSLYQAANPNPAGNQQD